jgi:hypothetical protein
MQQFKGGGDLWSIGHAYHSLLNRNIVLELIKYFSDVSLDYDDSQPSDVVWPVWDFGRLVMVAV